MCAQYTAENRRKYYPKPPKVPHPNSLKTPDDYPKEQERLAILAEKKRLGDEKKAKAQGHAEDAGTSKQKKRRLRKPSASPPPAVSDKESAHAAEVDADAAAQLEDSIDEDPAADGDDESE